MVFAFIGSLPCWVSCKQETIKEEMWYSFHCISCAELWAEPPGNFPLNCTLGCERCVDSLYVMPPHTPAWNWFRQHVSCNERYFSSVCHLKILRAGFTPQLCKRSCREIALILPASGGRWDVWVWHPLPCRHSQRRIQAFPEKDCPPCRHSQRRTGVITARAGCR